MCYNSGPTGQSGVDGVLNKKYCPYCCSERIKFSYRYDLTGDGAITKYKCDDCEWESIEEKLLSKKQRNLQMRRKKLKKINEN